MVPEIAIESICRDVEATETPKAFAKRPEFFNVSSKESVICVGEDVFTFPDKNAGARVSVEITVNIPDAMAVPVGLKTITRPVVAPVGTATEIVVAVAVNVVVDFEPNCTFVTVPNPVPVIVIEAPTKPLVAESAVIFGAPVPTGAVGATGAIG